MRPPRTIRRPKCNGGLWFGPDTTVLELGAGIDDLRRGDRVACGGAQHAHHAEIVTVPRNLVVPIPDAIALQGVRRAQPTIGETFVVLELGILGQLTA